MLSLNSVRDDELLCELTRLVKESRGVEAEVVAHVAEVELRRLYAPGACSSMFAYCRHVLGMRENEAYLRITVARASREHPVLLEMLGDGRLHLSGIARLAPLLTRENAGALLERASGMSHREVRELVAALAPKPDVASAIRKLPQRPGCHSAVSVGTVSGGGVFESAMSGNRIPGVAMSAWGMSGSEASDSGLSSIGTSSGGPSGGRTSGEGPSISGQSSSGPSGTAPSDDGLSSNGALGNRRSGDRTSDRAMLEGDAMADEAFLRGSSSSGRSAGGAFVTMNSGDQLGAPRVEPSSINLEPRVAVPVAASVRRPVVEPLSPGRYAVRFTASADLREKLERLQALMRASVPDGDLARIIEIALSEKLERLEARRFAQVKAPRTTPAQSDTSGASRHVPAAVRRLVHARDGGRCAYRDGNGLRCARRHDLEFHHKRPFARGGDHHADNISLMCRAHNTLLAEQDYGEDWMARFRSPAAASQRPGEVRGVLGPVRPSESRSLRMEPTSGGFARGPSPRRRPSG